MKAVNAKEALYSSNHVTACGEIAENVFAMDKLSIIDTHNEQLIILSMSLNPIAYLIFTRNSTDSLKGVTVEHEVSTTNALIGGKHMKFSRFSRVFQSSDFAFDLTIMDVYAL